MDSKLKIRGYHLLEAILCIMIFMSISASSFFIYTKATAGVKANAEMDNIVSIVSGTQDLYKGQPDLSSFDLKSLEQSGAIPYKMIVEGKTQLKNEWGNTFTVESSQTMISKKRSISDSLKITTRSVPSQDCAKLVDKIYKTYSGSLKSIAVNDIIIYSAEMTYDINLVNNTCTEKNISDIQFLIKI